MTNKMNLKGGGEWESGRRYHSLNELVASNKSNRNWSFEVTDITLECRCHLP